MGYTKENNGKEQQPYIPAGNGEKSGEYTFKFSSEFCVQEECTKADLKKILTKEEYEFVKRYTNFKHGRNLNSAIRSNSLSEFGKRMRDSILSAINKHTLKNDITVYRGIYLTNEIYIKNFYTNYVSREKIIGSLICSTTRSLKRAIRATFSTNRNGVAVVFEINLRKGQKALPVEDIAQRYQEREILISKPLYRIKRIEDWHLKNYKFKKIYIEIEKE